MANEPFAPAWYHHSRRCRTMKELILNADDFGLTQGINHGIIRAHRDGILTSATLMATGPAFCHAVEQAHANPTLGVGCHLVLTGGSAAAPREQIPSLVDENGRLPQSLTVLVANVTTGRVPPARSKRNFAPKLKKFAVRASNQAIWTPTSTLTSTQRS